MSSPARQRALVIPREHGAWGILLIPLITGAAVGAMRGGRAGALAPLAIAALALFWLRTPVESWVGASPVYARTAEERRLARTSALLLAAVAAAALASLFWGGRNLGVWRIGAIAAAALVAQAAIKRVWRGGRAAAQMTGAAGLTSVAAAAYYVATGRLDCVAWGLWAANFAFAADQIHYVQVRIHWARAATFGEKFAAGGPFFAGQVTLAAAVAGACAVGVFPWYAGAAFLPVLWRGFAWFAEGPTALAIHALGKRELAHAIAFGALLILGFSRVL